MLQWPTDTSPVFYKYTIPCEETQKKKTASLSTENTYGNTKNNVVAPMSSAQAHVAGINLVFGLHFGILKTLMN